MVYEIKIHYKMERKNKSSLRPNNLTLKDKIKKKC